MTAFRIERPATAFALSTGKKRPREHDDKHLKFIRILPCLVCGRRDVEAAHVRYGDQRYGKRETGKSEKPHDKWTVPLCTAHHREQHDANERTWWVEKGIDPLAIASALWASTGDEAAAELIIKNARRAG